MPPNTAMSALSGLILGVLIGIPLGRRIERAAWHADEIRFHAHIIGAQLTSIAARLGLLLLVIAAIAALAIWS